MVRVIGLEVGNVLRALLLQAWNWHSICRALAMHLENIAFQEYIHIILNVLHMYNHLFGYAFFVLCF